MRILPHFVGTARLLVVACAALQSGCSTEFGGLAYSDIGGLPPIDGFPQGEMSFRMLGDVSHALRDVSAFLAIERLPATIVSRPPRTLVVTSYVEEPSSAGARRIRRTAFRITLSDDSNRQQQPQCTYTSISSLTQSRGVREEAWTIQIADHAYEPALLLKLQALIEQHKCVSS